MTGSIVTLLVTVAIHSELVETNREGGAAQSVSIIALSRVGEKSLARSLSLIQSMKRPG